MTEVKKTEEIKFKRFQFFENIDEKSEKNGFDLDI